MPTLPAKSRKILEDQIERYENLILQTECAANVLTKQDYANLTYYKDNISAIREVFELLPEDPGIKTQRAIGEFLEEIR